MYWFTISYYDNSPDMYVKPLVMLSDKKQVMMVYAATPQQATEVAKELIKADEGVGEYQHHLPYIGTLFSCAHHDEIARWQADHAC
jgi:hypothetical protein